MNLSLKTKILFLSGFMAFVAVSIGSASYWFKNQTNLAYEEVLQHDVPALQSLNRMLLSFRVARIELLQLMTPGTTKEAASQSLSSIKEAWEKYDEDEKIYVSLLKSASEEEKKRYSDFKTIKETLRSKFDKALELYHANSDDLSAERKSMIQIVSVDLAEDGKKHSLASDDLLAYQRKAIQRNSDTAHRSADTGTMMIILITICGSALSFLFAVLFANRLSSRLNSIITSVSETSSNVALSSTQIASASQELSQATTELAASLEETTASLEEITAMVAKASENSDTTQDSSKESQKKAEEGQKAVEQMLSSMDDISQSNISIMNQVNQTNHEMTAIARLIKDIGNKTKVINEIVFQTKLLSFNASVEAARAGEHGKGFAVVAEEVGNLAQMSGNAAKEITDMLDNSIVKVEQIVKDTQSKVEQLIGDGKQKVESGMQVANQCATLLEQIVRNVSTVTGLAEEISTASKEQAQGISEINKAMTQIDAVTQQNAATTNQVATAAEDLSGQAESLRTAVNHLTDSVRGKHFGDRSQKINSSNALNFEKPTTDHHSSKAA